MKISVKTSVLITVILTAILNASTPVCRAQDQTETANLVAVSTVPASGTFWSMQLTNFPPLPFDPLPDLPLYTDGQFYFYDDRSVSYPADWSPFPVVASSGSGGMAMDDGPPSPGGFGTGSGGVPAAEALHHSSRSLRQAAATQIVKLGPIFGSKLRTVPTPFKSQSAIRWLACPTICWKRPT